MLHLPPQEYPVPQKSDGVESPRLSLSHFPEHNFSGDKFSVFNQQRLQFWLPGIIFIIT
jgi:hypothetical protein